MTEHEFVGEAQAVEYATGVHWEITCTCGAWFGSPAASVAEENLAQHIAREKDAAANRKNERLYRLARR